jgi:hypothetical protein
MRTLVLGAALTACIAGSAMAAGQPKTAWLTLKAHTSTGHVVVDGAVWTCKVNVCRSARVKAGAAETACRRLAADLGEVTGFGYRGEIFTPEAVAACNAK